MAGPIVGEALSNASRHANAQHVSVSLEYRFWSLKVEVSDDGNGMDPLILRQGRREGHFGLVGMRERADRLGESLVIRSQAGQGTKVSLRVPGRIAYLSLWKRTV